jgi:hypothetical protein
MGQLKLDGMKAAYDEIITTAVKRQHEPQKIVGNLLQAGINEKQARSIKYQMIIAKLPLAKEIDELSFEDTPVNDTLVRISPAATSSSISETWFWSAAPEPASRISPSASDEPALQRPACATNCSMAARHCSRTNGEQWLILLNTRRGQDRDRKGRVSKAVEIAWRFVPGM